MPFGLDADKELVFRWRWMPIPPCSEDYALPPVVYQDDAAIAAVELGDDLWELFRFNFATLAKQTPSLHFYRLVRIFNTPLLTMTHKEARQSEFAYWNGVPPAQTEGHNFAHFWYFTDPSDGAKIAFEYGFDHSFRMRSTMKSPLDMAKRHAEIVSILPG